MMLGVIVPQILSAGAPVDEELSLLGAVSDPLKTHVDCLRPFLLDGSIGKTDRRGVVDLHGSWRLRVTEF